MERIAEPGLGRAFRTERCRWPDGSSSYGLRGIEVSIQYGSWQGVRSYLMEHIHASTRAGEEEARSLNWEVSLEVPPFREAHD